MKRRRSHAAAVRGRSLSAALMSAQACASAATPNQQAIGLPRPVKVLDARPTSLASWWGETTTSRRVQSVSRPDPLVDRGQPWCCRASLIHVGLRESGGCSDGRYHLEPACRRGHHHQPCHCNTRAYVNAVRVSRSDAARASALGGRAG